MLLFWPIVAVLAVVAFGSPSAAEGPIFEEVAATAGVQWPHQKVEEYWAVGQAWGDADGDGLLDLYLTDHVGPNRLLRNLGDGTFAPDPRDEDTRLPGVASAGAVFGDFDEDGDQDLYVSNRGSNALFRNDGVEGFVDVASAAGVDDSGKGSTAAWGDFDGDGWLDLYVANWMHDDCMETNGVCATNGDRLYRNLGDGTFEDVTVDLGLEATWGLGFVASFLDYDDDGDLDIYLVNDRFRNPIGNKLWRNDGPAENCGATSWCWEEVSGSTGSNLVMCGMGLAVCDLDNDQDLDLFISNAPGCEEPIGLHRLLWNQSSQGGTGFIEGAEVAGVALETIGWGVLCVDFDNDGWSDLYATTSGPFPDTVNHLLLNQRDGTFVAIGDGSGADDDRPTWGVAAADYDEDGWTDLVTTNRDFGTEGHRLYRHRGELAYPGRGSLTLELRGGGGVPLDAVGARVELERSDGLVLTQEVKSGSSLGAGNTRRLQFGLDAATVLGATIRWPDGRLTAADDLDAAAGVVLIRYAALFEDGFESGDPSAWDQDVSR